MPSGRFLYIHGIDIDTFIHIHIHTSIHIKANLQNLQKLKSFHQNFHFTPFISVCGSYVSLKIKALGLNLDRLNKFNLHLQYRQVLLFVPLMKYKEVCIRFVVVVVIIVVLYIQGSM